MHCARNAALQSYRTSAACRCRNSVYAICLSVAAHSDNSYFLNESLLHNLQIIAGSCYIDSAAYVEIKTGLRIAEVVVKSSNRVKRLLIYSFSWV